MNKIFFGLTSFLLALLLTGCQAPLPDETTVVETTTQTSSGQGLAQKLNVPEHFVSSFTSSTGVTRINVDAQVIVPDVDSVDLYEALPRTFSKQDVDAFFQRHQEGLTWENQATQKPYEEEGFAEHIGDNNFADYRFEELWLYNDEEFDTGRDYHSIIFHQAVSQKTGTLVWSPSLDYLKARMDIGTASHMEVLPLTDGKAAGCSLSLEEAQAYADAEAACFANDFALARYGQIPVMEAINNPQYYIFRYTRKINGIAVNEVYGAEELANSYDFTSGLESLTILVNDEGVCSVNYYNPFQVGKKLQENVKLLTFDQIADIFEKVAPLSIQHLERYEDLEKNTMEVYRIELGYMALRQAGTGEYHYVPVWDFYAYRVLSGTGAYAHGEDYPPISNQVGLTINAIDGTVIDRQEGY